jgi:hypothetical protein
MARAIARLYAALLDDIAGVRLISRERLREVSAVAFEGVDEIFGLPATWALGYSIGRPGADRQGAATAFGWGGSHAYAEGGVGPVRRRRGWRQRAPSESALPNCAAPRVR